MSATRRVLFVLADGARPDVLEELRHAGRLPNMARLFPPEEAPVRRAATTMPSATGPAYLPFLTGRFAGAVNAPGIRWFDRFAYAQGRRFASKRSYVGAGSRYWDRDLEPTVRTLFQYEPDHVNVYNPIARGVRPGRNRLAGARILLSPAAKYLGRWRALDNRVRRETLRAVQGGARFVASTFMGIDENSHDHGVRHASTLDAYRFLDESIGDIVTALERRGDLDTTRIVVSSDHGLSDTHEHFPLAEFVEAHGYTPIYYPRLWRWKPNAAVMVSGNALAHVYLQRKGSWTQRPRGSALWAEHGELMADLARHPSVDLLVYRDDAGGLVVQRGDARTRLRRVDGQVKFDTFGTNPLGLPPEMRTIGDQELLRQSWDLPYPDPAVQLDQLFESPRCGDVVVMSRPGHDLRLRFEVPRHHASHGSLHRDHLLVPLLVNDPELDTVPCRTVDAFLYMLDQLGHKPMTDVDGRHLPRRRPPEPPPVLSEPEPASIPPPPGPVSPPQAPPMPEAPAT